MTAIDSDFRVTKDDAKHLRFQPAAGITSTNVQDAIEEAASSPPTITPTAVGVSPYAPLAADTLLYVTVVPMVINLPASASRGGKALEIKDRTGNASAATPITINPAGGETVDGLAPLLVNINYGGWKLYPLSGGGWTTAP